MSDQNKQMILFSLAFVLRLPFLFFGYGVEEDSWGHVLNAALMYENGSYEISRLPGHPILEALLMVLWKVHSPFLFNLPAALASSGSVVVFYRILNRTPNKLAMWWSIAFSMIPIMYISGTYTVDYSLALFFSLLSYESLISGKLERAGIWLAVATGFRITSLGFLIPFAYWLLVNKEQEKSKALRLRKVAKLFFISIGVSLIFYIPPMHNYGMAFFDFHRPPYPNFVEAIYKTTIGPWGVLGIIAVIIAKTQLIKRKSINFKNREFNFLFLVILVYGIAFFRMPEKAAFWLPVVPFSLMYISRHVSLLIARLSILFLIFSPLLFGINKTDPYTGSDHSPLAITFGSADGELFFDPIQGPIFNDYTKRINKLEAVEKIEHNIMLIRKPTVVIAGWWYAMIEVDKRDGKWSNANIKVLYYALPKELEQWKEKGYELRYLPKQEIVNDKKYNTTYTVNNATLLPIE